jgi:hypothetical protein
LEDPDIDRRAIKNEFSRNRIGGMGWVYLAHEREKWQALVTMVMNFQVLQNVGNFLTS